MLIDATEQRRNGWHQDGAPTLGAVLAIHDRTRPTELLPLPAGTISCMGALSSPPPPFYRLPARS